MQPSSHHAIATIKDATDQRHSGVDRDLTVERTELIERIDDILPQTQCQKCGYVGCKPYAEAIAQGAASINQCPPGGEAGIQALATLLKRPYQPLNTDHGLTKPKAIAIIDEQRCIGCTLCIKACPVDAILGASKHMHTVISQECTGCELCLAPCPVDCIVMQPVVQPDDALKEIEHARSAANLARQRHQHRLMRLDREKQIRTQTGIQRQQALAADVEKPLSELPPTDTSNDAIKKAAIAAAMARIKALKTGLASPKPDS